MTVSREEPNNLFKAINRVLARGIALPLLALYRKVGSPVAYALGSRCRFYPSCSHYAEDALRYHGFTKGLVLSTVRLAKCNPLHPGGFDPVPPKMNDKRSPVDPDDKNDPVMLHDLHVHCSHQH